MSKWREALRLSALFFDRVRSAGPRQALRAVARKGMGAFARRLAQFLPPANVEDLNQLRGEIARLDWVTRQHREAVFLLAEQRGVVARPLTPGLRESAPYFSIVTPTWNRASTLHHAIESVLAQSDPSWELLIVDDGSDDETAEIVRRYAADERIRYFARRREGVCAARNFALRQARGEVIAYLDSDNIFYVDALAGFRRAFEQDPEAECAYLAHLVRESTGDISIKAEPFDFERLFRLDGWLDLNTFAHKRSHYERVGGFDESMTRLVDRDLILRMTRDKPARYAPVLGGRYEQGDWPRVSNREGFHRNYYLIRRKHETPLKERIRVLYICDSFPHLTESYIYTEIEAMLRRGVEIAVWSPRRMNDLTTVDVPIYRGDLIDACQDWRPDVVHVHWLNVADVYREAIDRIKTPITLRAHAFEVNQETLLRRGADRTRRVFIHPSLLPADQPIPEHFTRIHSCFSSERYYPGESKDRRLVVRTCSALPTRSIPSFFRVAAECREFKFVLIVGRAAGMPQYSDKIVKWNEDLGSPAEVFIDMAPTEVASYVRRAGIYFLTYPKGGPFGMPISVAEAMATGCYVIARERPEARQYIADVGGYYLEDDDAIARIRETLTWDDGQWRDVARRAVERAYQFHNDIDATEPILQAWRKLAQGMNECESVRSVRRAA